ncbi:phage major capsid protein [uncultured Agitococcus sp.]|uniref:phage major capsid protein n=1 Tax=uncultured Agitococcus sp. TaxID=1506599 RepID=UPI002622398F|nr:phage major capsid protein [uncultured Agitococcus sp.]
MSNAQNKHIIAAIGSALAVEEKHVFGVRKVHRRETPDDLTAIAKKLNERMKTLDDLINKHKDTLENGKLPDELRKKLDDDAKVVSDLAARFSEIEQKLVDQVHQRQADPNTVGSILARNTELRQQIDAIRSKRGRTTIDGIQARNIISIAGIGTNASLATIDVQRNQAQELTLALLDLITWMPVTNDLVPNLRESAYDIMADEVAEGLAKPESNLTFGVENITISVIAHWIKITKQLLDDMPVLASYIEGRLAYGVRLKLEAKVINGTTTSFSGLMKVGNSLVAVPDALAIDTINTAKYQVWGSGLMPEAVVLNPVDWGKIEREKTDDGHYLFGTPGAVVQPVIWGLPVVLSSAMPLGKFWLGNLTIGVSGYVRNEVMVEASTEDGDNFTKNLVTIRAEMRAGFGVAIPDAMVTGDLVAVAP